MVGGYVFVATAPVLGLAVYCLMHLIACRCRWGRGVYGPLIGSFFPGLFAAVLVTAWATLEMRAPAWDVVAYLCMNVVAYGALGWGYFHFVNMNIASLRIRMLYELAESHGRMPKARLLALYGTEQMIAVRIDRLVRGGHLVQRQERYYCGKPHFLYAARFFDGLRWFILGSNMERAQAIRTRSASEGSNPLPR